MRYLDIICEQAPSGKVVSTSMLVKRYGGSFLPYAQLPEPAQKALTRWMVYEGENTHYKRSSYGYVEVPIDDLMKIIWNQNGFDDGVSFEEFWGKPSGMNPKVFNEVWPLIWSSQGWEDGMHRLGHYRKLGLKMIPVVGSRR
jgi:hypothetical protein